MNGSKFSHLFFALAVVSLGARQIQAQPLTSTGELLASPRAPAGQPLPADVDARFIGALYGFRDSVYESAPPDEVEKAAQDLIRATKSRALTELDRYLILARIEYLAGRSWNEAGDKKKAIPHFEAAMDNARLSMESGEHPAGLMAHMKPLSELCLLKDMGYLIANGPKISQNARKVLAMEPGRPGAVIVLAEAKAYPPAIFGGNPKEAIARLTALIDARDEGFEKDDLFDLRACVATALSKLGRADEARFWFQAALELYPRNNYAASELKKAKP
ncbi:MAG TPA: hypothetical protein VN445_08475 [Rectinemataceae bacterium]|nr:hypothetical protein [Rectinemataceae bacterium]